MFNRNAADRASLQSGQFTATMSPRQGLKTACLQKPAWRNGIIAIEKFQQLAQPLAPSGYGQCMLRLSNKEVQL